MSAHKKYIDFARSIPVSLITAHVVKGNQILTWRDAGMLGPDVLFSHCNVLADRQAPDDEMWAAMKESGAAIGSTPEDELGMAHGNPVAFDALKRGLKVGLGVVSAVHNIGTTNTHASWIGRDLDQRRRYVHGDAFRATARSRHVAVIPMHFTRIY